jgi:4-hydroxymandelate oxidase
VLVDVAERKLATTVLGSTVSLPVLVAPMAFHALAHSEESLRRRVPPPQRAQL